MSDTPHITYSREAILTAEEMAAVLKISVRQLDRQDLPCVYLGNRTRRYVYGQVLDALMERAAA
ncbi:MAG: hypothetical protein ACYC3F_16820 [Gemmatimonadaceae bacterium]